MWCSLHTRKQRDGKGDSYSRYLPLVGQSNWSWRWQTSTFEDNIFSFIIFWMENAGRDTKQNWIKVKTSKSIVVKNLVIRPGRAKPLFSVRLCECLLNFTYYIWRVGFIWCYETVTVLMDTLCNQTGVTPTQIRSPCWNVFIRIWRL